MSENKVHYDSLSDEVLAEFSKNGDDNAFNELVIRYLNKIRFIARTAKHSTRTGVVRLGDMFH